MNETPPIVRSAVILAAGLGQRLGPFSRRLPKPLLPVGGMSMLENSLRQLSGAGVERSMIVLGHLGDAIEERIGNEYAGMAIDYVHSERYESTNDIYSLWLARDRLCEDAFILHADVHYEAAVLEAMRAGPGENVIAVAQFTPSMNGTVVSLGAEGSIEQIHYAADQGTGFDYRDKYKTVNIYLLRGDYLVDDFAPELDRIVAGEGRVGECFEVALAPALRTGTRAFRAADCTSLRWYEVDTHEERRTAEYLAKSPGERLETIAGQHGGYWRHEVVDHCLLTNAHFPPTALVDELAKDFDPLVRQYPVGHVVLAELAGSAFDRDPAHLIVGNGSSELIKLLIARARQVIVPVPGFNEYENATAPDRLTRFELPLSTFDLDVGRFADAAAAHSADLAIVVSPNNPTSMAVEPEALAWLARALASQGCTLLLDESFIDFCPQPECRTLESAIGWHPNLVVLKSVSKVYGVGGLRLGYLLTSDVQLVRDLRAALPIWNVNGFAEGFLRILPRYLADFEASCARTRAETDRLRAALAALSGVKAFPADANYVFLHLPEGLSAHALVEWLFARHGVLAKDCGSKSMPDGDRYLRVASRTEPHNRRFVDMLAEGLERVPREGAPSRVDR